MMLKWNEINNVLPFAASILSIYLLISNFSTSFVYFFSAVLCISGLAFWWAGKIKLGESFAYLPKAKRLVTTGIYSRIRHPIYVGVILVLAGWSILFGSVPLLIFTLFIIIFSVFRAKEEEKVLLRKFGKEYLKYRTKTCL